MAERGHDQGAVEELVEALARALGHEQTTVTGGALEVAVIEADRLNAKEAAGDLFGEGRHSEEEGERLLRQRDYDAAQLAFSRAATLFQKAGELSFEERLRQQNLSATR